MSLVDRILLALAGLTGFLGVAGSAAAAHSDGGETLRMASTFLLLHAPLIVGLVSLSLREGWQAMLARIAGGTILLGLALFSGDLALRALAGTPLFPMAAPSGGIVLMAGWLLVMITGLLPRGR